MTRVVLIFLALSSLAAGLSVARGKAEANGKEQAEQAADGSAQEAADEAAHEAAQETGVALKPADIRSEPFRDAIGTGSLEPGDEVEILEKKRGWYRVKTAEKTGWVRMLSIRRGEPRRADLDMEGLLSLASGRAGTGRVIATTGIRGLSEEELKEAEFDEKDLEALESLAVTPEQAQKFAAKGNLVARKLEYLPAPPDGKEKEVWWPR